MGERVHREERVSGVGGQPAAHEILGTVFHKLQSAVMFGEATLCQLAGADAPARPAESPPANLRSMIHAIDELATRATSLAEAIAAECGKQDAQVARGPGYR